MTIDGVAVNLDTILHPTEQPPSLVLELLKLACRHVWLWFRKLLIITGLLWAALLGALQWVQPTSRRACNMPYVLLSLTLNWMMLLLFVCGSMLSGCCKALPLLDACSQNMLFLFLLANVLTGLVNMTINSLLISDGHAIGIVSAYMLLICCVACLVHNKKVRNIISMTNKCSRSTVKKEA